MPRVLYFLLLKQVARFQSTGQGRKKKMAHGNYHWLLFTIYLNTPHDQQQYTLRKEKKALHERRERYNAFRISADLLHAVVLRGVGTYWVKWSGFFLIRRN